MKSIFLLTNFSEAANKAIRNFIRAYGAKLKGEYRLILVNAWKQPRTGHFQMIDLDEYLQKISIVDLDRASTYLIKELNWPKKDLDVVSMKGDIVDVITQLAEQNKPDLIVAGTKGTNLMREIIAGSTTGRILRLIKLPTILIPETAEYINPDRIVIASDLQECKNRDDFEQVTNLVRRLMAELLILHIYKAEKPNVEKFEKCMEPYLMRINYAFHYKQHISVEKGILKFVKNMNAGLLVLIGRKDELLIQLLKNSVTQAIVQRAAFSMLVIHE